MLVHRPIETDRLTQKFGESNACIKTGSQGEILFPTKVVAKVNNSCPLGFASFYERIGMKGHNGWDNAAYYREPIYFPVITDTRWWAKEEIDPDGGIGVDVYSLDPVFIKQEDLPSQMSDHAKLFLKDNKIHVKFRFWHLQSSNLKDRPQVKVGVFADGSPQMKPEIKIGDLIGWCDSTGASSGDHLHWSMKFCAPNSTTVGNDNGYTGAGDFSKLYRNVFILDLLGQTPVLTPSQKVAKLVLTAKTGRLADILRSIAQLVFSFGN